VKKHLVDFLFVFLIAGSFIFFYYRVSASAISLHKLVNSSSPNVFDESRLELGKKYYDFLASGLPDGNPTLLHYLTGVQRKFLDLRIDQAIKEIKNRPVAAEKIHVWSLMNMGSVIKTQNKIIVFDAADVPFSTVHKQLADMADIFIASHADADHYDLQLLEKAIKNGKEVVVLEGLMTGNKNPHVHPLKSGQTIDINGVKITAYQTDHRGDDNFIEPSAWFLVKVDGFTVLHTGDGRDFKNEDEKNTVYGRNDIDILLVNNTIHPYNIRDLKPKVFVPLHLYKWMSGKEFLNNSNFDSVNNNYIKYKTSLISLDKKMLFNGEGFKYSK
jgi:L-ascorbate metabolism protein UlaG (beta-lactamase superfamily)